MPIKIRGGFQPPTSPTTPTQPEDEGDTWSAIGEWLSPGDKFTKPSKATPEILAAGTRGVTGMLAGEGGPTGAAIAGGGEGLAQAIEFFSGVDPEVNLPGRLARVGVEAGLGAIPGASIVKQGNTLRNVIRGGAHAGVGNLARQAANQGTLVPDVDTGSLLTHTTIGGGVAGGMSKLADMFGVGQTPKPGAPNPIAAEQDATIRAGQTRGPIRPELRPSEEVGGIKIRQSSAPAPRGLDVRSMTPDDRFKFEEEIRNAFSGKLDKAPDARAGLEDVDAAIAANINDAAKRAQASGKFETNAQRAEERADYSALQANQRAQTQAAKTAERQAAQTAEADAARAQIDEAIEAGQLTPGKPVVTESFREPVEGGSRSLRRSFTSPDEPDDEVAALADTLGVPRAQVGPNKGVQRQIPAAPQPEAVPQEDFGQMILNEGQPFRSRLDATGANYRDIKTARNAGEAVPEGGRRAAGRSLQREGQAANMPPRGPIPPDAPGQVAPEVAPQAPDWVQDQLGVVERLKRLMEQPFTKGNPESGAVAPEIPMALSSGLLGGAIGAATDPLGTEEESNPLMSALLGAGIGFGAPMLARRGPGFVENIRESLGSVEDARETALQFLERIPNIQRSNLLASGEGLPINAFVGPWGSAITGGLEQVLKGNPEGWQGLKNVINPVTFARDMWRNKDEALQLLKQGELGREGIVGVGDSAFDAMLAFPAWAMTAGDTTGLQGMMKAGIPEHIARKYMLTSEPEGLQKLAHLGAGGTTTAERLGNFALNTTFPYKRTPVNIFEQGAQRFPVLGGLGKLAMGSDAREVAAEQAIAIPGAVGSYYAGKEMEESNPTLAKTGGRFVSNISGVNSLGNSLAYNLGRGVQRGDSAKSMAPEVARNLLPMPSDRALEDIWNLFTSGEVPRGALPAFVRDQFVPAKEPVRQNVPRIPSIRNRRSS